MGNPLGELVAAYADATERGTCYDQLLTARELAAYDGSPETSCERALLHESRLTLASSELRFDTAGHEARLSADAWGEAGEHANELVMRMAQVNAQICELDEATLEIVPLVEKLGHLLTAVRAAGPSPRRLVDALLTAGFSAVRIERLDDARRHFAEAMRVSADDVDRVRALSATALCERTAGNESLARTQITEAAALAREAGDVLALATALRMLTGMLGADPKHAREALALAEETVELSVDLGDVFFASTLRLRGLLRLLGGQAAAGREDLERSILLLRDSAWQHTLPAEVLTLAEQYFGVNERLEAVRVLREYGDLLDRATGDERIAVDVFRYVVAVTQQDFAGAAGYAGSAARLMEQAHHKDTAQLYEAAADAWQAAGDGEQSAQARAAVRRVTG